ncbi:NAD(P)-dependent oxidoreductase [Salipiger sp. PrR002]|uniref:NAD-dependent epimerase/dehydratase family protein n=1 Tax=Salipiger sp. PrR002 TaxID=2706489 RepID=UPI0013BB48CC|nr:NAD-dependent epimerase/dehydratase family protein [Salipiger sp. PrR002]NDV99600.1 NAD-dependent epimerase/dehydratase family protein [Salipiger sp. PrR002]NDW57246.1 NAD-dependent epimerase/dehydratase family protein [Salipiger sp. PrR004]
MRILVTGGAGFIGSHLTERLIAEGHDVSILDDLSTGVIENLDAVIADPRVRFVEGSVLDKPLVEQLVCEADLVFHLAAAVGVKVIMEQPSRSMMTNINGTENVLTAALIDKTPVFIASTSEVYGKAAKIPFHEDDDLTIGATRNLRWSYACAKTLDEFLALAYAREADLPVVVLRFFNTTGPRQTGRYGMVLPNFVQAALEGAPLMIHGDGQQSRCFGHALDVVEALVRLMNTPDAIGQVFNIGNDREITIEALAKQVIEATGSSSEIRYIPYEEVYPHGFEDMMRRVPDVQRLKSVTGFRPERSLATIIEDIIAEKRSNSAKTGPAQIGADITATGRT